MMHIISPLKGQGPVFSSHCKRLMLCTVFQTIDNQRINKWLVICTLASLSAVGPWVPTQWRAIKTSFFSFSFSFLVQGISQHWEPDLNLIFLQLLHPPKKVFIWSCQLWKLKFQNSARKHSSEIKFTRQNFGFNSPVDTLKWLYNIQCSVKLQCLQIWLLTFFKFI